MSTSNHASTQAEAARMARISQGANARLNFIREAYEHYNKLTPQQVRDRKKKQLVNIGLTI